MRHEKLVNDNQYLIGHFLLRAGIAFAFLYPPIAALADPLAWAAYFPDFVTRLPVSTTVLLHAFGVVEIIIAVWIMSGRSIRIPAAIATVLLIGIMAANPGDFPVLFRDVTIAFGALALAFMPRPTARQLVNDGA